MSEAAGGVRVGGVGVSLRVSMLHADTPRNRLVGMSLISLTYLVFTCLDTSAKWLVQALPVLQVVWLRFAAHSLFAAAVLGPRHGRSLLRSQRPRLQALRALLLLAMTALNFAALQYLQLTVVSAIFFTVPVLIAVFGAALLGERLDAGRWMAILVAFAGVLIVVRPFGATFHPAMLLSLANAVLQALFSVLTRRLSAHDPPETTQFLSALGAAIALAPFGLAVWQAPNAAQWMIAGLLGIFGGTGHFLYALAHRRAPASVLGAFIYQQVVYMAIVGYLVFGDVPEMPVAIGAAIVIGSGLYLLRRERRMLGPEAAE